MTLKATEWLLNRAPPGNPMITGQEKAMVGLPIFILLGVLRALLRAHPPKKVEPALMEVKMFGSNEQELLKWVGRAYNHI